MDQYDFKFEITIIGLEVEDFIQSLMESGYIYQAKEIKDQFDKQISDNF